jgi:hypothetical protein
MNSDKPCDTLGLASLGSICDKERSCNINEDTGLTTAFTIAHETAHNFNAEHDSPENGCGVSNSTSYLMNTHLNSINQDDFIWSPCSQREITKFLE